MKKGYLSSILISFAVIVSSIFFMSGWSGAASITGEKAEGFASTNLGQTGLVCKAGAVAEADSCGASLDGNFNLHVPVVIVSGVAYWADFAYIQNTMDFTLTNLGTVSDLSPFSSCAPSTLSNDLVLHIPAVNVGTDSYWADLQYEHDLVFTLTGAGETSPISDYSMADLTGNWEGNSLASGPCTPWWERADLNIGADGSLTASTLESSGSTNQLSGGAGTVSITPNGVITFSGASGVGLQGSMDSGKTVMVWTGTWVGGCAGGTEMKVFTRKAASYSMADLAGTWVMNELGSDNPWWSRGTFTIAADGSFSGVTSGYDGSSAALSGTVSMSPDGVITASGASFPDSFSCNMNAGKTIFVCTSTRSDGQTDMHVFTKKT